MAVETRGVYPKLQRPGLDVIWGEEYEDHDFMVEKMFRMGTSDMNYEEDVEISGYGLAEKKAEGASITYDQSKQFTSYKYRHNTFALGFIETMEEKQDNLYLRTEEKTRMLAFSARTTREIEGANIFSQGFSTVNTFGDGKEAFALDHPTLAGNQQNELTIAANLSEKALEDLCILTGQAKNNRGLQIAIRPQMLLVPPALQFEANRILESTLQNDTANNATNALRNTGMFPEGILVNPYLTSTKAFFVKTDAPNGFKGFDRMLAEFGEDNDSDTKNTKYCYIARYSFGVSDWRGYYASPGV